MRCDFWSKVRERDFARRVGSDRVPLAVRERAQLAKAKRSGSRRRPTRLISCAGYAREQARSSPPSRIFLRAFGTRPARWLPCKVRLRGRRSRAGACPARPCDRALWEPALRIDPERL